MAGALTLDDLMTVWKSVVDPAYSQPLLENPDSGVEVIEQVAEQLSRLSVAVERSTQSLYILPWSGQTEPPSSGWAPATVELEVTRIAGWAGALVLRPGWAAEALLDDFSPDGTIIIGTRRLFALGQPAFVFAPGVAGPLSVLATATRMGTGGNLPPPGTITRPVQFGTPQNLGASVIPGIGAHRLVLAPVPDVVSPLHIGTIIELTSGANAGQRRSMVGYAPPGPLDGGTALLDAVGIVVVAAVVGVFQPGERVEQGATAGTVLALANGRLIFDAITGVFVNGPIVAPLSGATATITSTEQSSLLVAETGTASWRVLDWNDLLTVTNPLSPTGGTTGELDELGGERNIDRAPGESDESYRKRVVQLPDLVSPNALRRVVNRILTPYGAAGCLREVGSTLLPGFYCDGGGSNVRAHNFACDMDSVQLAGVTVGTFFEGEVIKQVGPGGHVALGRVVLNGAGGLFGAAAVHGVFVPGFPAVGQKSGASVAVGAVTGGLDPHDRFKLVLDYEEFRAFFLVGIPPQVLGDFGFATDDHPYGFVDASPYYDFLDGSPLSSQIVALSIWNALDKARAAGVGFDLYVENLGCF